MTKMFGPVRERRIDWRRELPPVLMVAGLAADYLSPSALWTMLLPFGAIVMLFALRKWAYAAVVFVLCSWVLIPVAAGTVTALEESRGQHRLFVVEDADLPSLEDARMDPCARQIERTTLPVGSEHVFNPRWALRGVVETFADLHNAMVIDRLYEDASGACFDGNVPTD
ncbi:MAG TPA: hypothetical protein VIF57_08225 [Polyangia bacterium]|jgi:hypothetical protein